MVFNSAFKVLMLQCLTKTKEEVIILTTLVLSSKSAVEATLMQYKENL